MSFEESEHHAHAVEQPFFYQDNTQYFDFDGLRSLASTGARSGRLIQSACMGNRAAAMAMKKYLWPFVREFELAIDRRYLPRDVLRTKFGTPMVRNTYGRMARMLKQMKAEEGGHAAHWVADAKQLGMSSLDEVVLPSVAQLNREAYVEDTTSFFAFLAGTEFAAEELSRALTASTAFTGMFARGRWAWGDVHLMTHDGPSHLELDMDLARAYAGNETAKDIEAQVARAISLFIAAMDEISEVPGALDGFAEMPRQVA